MKLQRDKVFNYSASTAFFVILSLFPFLMTLLTMLQYTPLTKSFLMDRLDYFLPNLVFPLFQEIIDEIYSTTIGTSLILATTLGGIWSASKGIMTLIRGINVCFNIDDKRSWIRVRLLSCLYTIAIIVVVLIAGVILVFGSYFYNLLLQKPYLGTFLEIVKFLLKQKFWVLFIILTLAFTLIYKFLPARRIHFLHMLPGGILAALATLGLTEILSAYQKAFPNFSYTYGSLTYFILLMLLLYFCMYIIFICAEINFFFRSKIIDIAIKRKRKKISKYNNKIEKKEEKKKMQK